MWRLTQKLLKLRHDHPALSLGEYAGVDATGDILAYERRHGDDRILIILNLGATPQSFAIPEWAEGLSVLLAAQGGSDPAILAPNEGYILG